MSDGEHAAMHPVKAPRSDATADRAGAQPERDELPARNDAVLLQRTLRDRSIKGVLRLASADGRFPQDPFMPGMLR